MTSDFTPEFAKYPKSSPKPKIAQNSVRSHCLAPLAMQLVVVVVEQVFKVPLDPKQVIFFFPDNLIWLVLREKEKNRRSKIQNLG